MPVELFGVESLSTRKLVTGRREQLCRRIACSRVSGLEKAAGVPRANGLDQGRRGGVGGSVCPMLTRAHLQTLSLHRTELL